MCGIHITNVITNLLVEEVVSKVIQNHRILGVNSVCFWQQLNTILDWIWRLTVQLKNGKTNKRSHTLAIQLKCTLKCCPTSTNTQSKHSLKHILIYKHLIYCEHARCYWLQQLIALYCLQTEYQSMQLIKLLAIFKCYQATKKCLQDLCRNHKHHLRESQCTLKGKIVMKLHLQWNYES